MIDKVIHKIVGVVEKGIRIFTLVRIFFEWGIRVSVGLSVLPLGLEAGAMVGERRVDVGNV